MNREPRFCHDCGSCEYLRSIEIDNNVVDVYRSCQGSLLVRFGDEGPDYESAPIEYVSPSGCSLLSKAARAMSTLTNELRINYSWNTKKHVH
jgi:hypothetical protein